jgi:hypothetical protein
MVQQVSHVRHLCGSASPRATRWACDIRRGAGPQRGDVRWCPTGFFKRQEWPISATLCLSVPKRWSMIHAGALGRRGEICGGACHCLRQTADRRCAPTPRRYISACNKRDVGACNSHRGAVTQRKKRLGAPFRTPLRVGVCQQVSHMRHLFATSS